MINGQPKVVWSSIQPAASGGIAEASVRGTLVTLAAAARSGGVTTLITNALRTGTSMLDTRLRAIRQPTASRALGANAAAISMIWPGRCVKTIVRSGPIRRSMRTATKPDAADRICIADRTTPALPTVKWCRRNNHSTNNDCTANPPANESRLNNAASWETMRLDGPSGVAGEAWDAISTSGDIVAYTPSIATPANA